MSHLLFVFAIKRHLTCVLSLFQNGFVSLEDGAHELGIFVACCSCLLLFGQLTVDGFEVFQLQLGVDDAFILQRIDRHAALTHDIVVVEAADNVDDSVTLADVSQELIAQTFAFRRTFYQARNVDNLAGCGHNAAGMHQRCQLV